MTETFICAHCGGTRPQSALEIFDETAICHDCFMSETTICAHCGERIWNRDNAATEYTPICQTCCESHYSVCEDCGALVHNDSCCYVSDEDDNPYCHRCIENHRTDCGIQSYYYRPEPIFHGDGNRYFGVELEIDNGGESDSVADLLLGIGNREDDYIYIKHDGSLDDGMEIVTHPMTLEFHRDIMPWEELTHTALRQGYYSHRAQTCGLHVHVNRNSLGDTCAIQEDVIARILYFVEAHWNELLCFSRRTQRQLNKWAARYGRKDSPKEVLDIAKHSGGSRYTCVNLTNADTIEFRIFRGTLKPNTILATLELVDQLCSVALSYSDTQMQELTWTAFVRDLDGEKYEELIQYLKERRLYVSEPVEVEDET
ncbi:amidoligase family protein [Bengtsoniella intestinalis]|uniref:amidoligase family protein n=1 Tax=Bengtsoniella intestinalis TaxID=3073143 RepID=UPI00391F83A4